MTYNYAKQIDEEKTNLRNLIEKSKTDGMTDEIRSAMNEASDRLEDYQARQAELDRALKLADDLDKAEYRKQAEPIIAEPEKDAEAEYRSAFDGWIRTGEMRTVTDYQNKGVSADGGYLAPADFYNRLITFRDKKAVIRNLATVLSVDRDLNIPTESTNATASWVAEGATISYTKKAFAQAQLILRKLVCKIGITEEMLADSKLNMADIIGNEIARQFVQEEEDAFINGTAANNKPVGILQSSITTTRAAATTAVTASDIVNVYEALGAEYRDGATWIISPALEAVLIQLATSGGFPLFVPSWVKAVPHMLLGYPVKVSSYLDNSIAANKINAVFGDFSYYVIGDKGSYSLTRYDKRDVDGTFAFLGSERVGGVCVNTDAFAILQQKAS